MEKFHKRVSKKQRFLILSEHFDSGLSISELSRKYQIAPITIYKWREKMKQKTMAEILYFCYAVIRSAGK